MAQYLARCHCGALSGRYETEIAPCNWPVRACQCSFCRAHAALSTSDPHGALEFSCARPSLLQRYRFASGRTEFLICRECGVYLGAQMARAGGRLAVLNARALVPVPPDLAQAVAVSYEGESGEARNARRKALWTPLTTQSL